MERIKIRTQSLMTQMVALTPSADLSVNETKSACVPIKATARVPITQAGYISATSDIQYILSCE